MTIDEALEALGMASHPGQVELRRAYLAKIKAHKPELDPVGFTRVRSAYELLRDAWLPLPEDEAEVRVAASSPELANVEPAAAAGASPPVMLQFAVHEFRAAMAHGRWAEAFEAWDAAGIAADGAIEDDQVWRMIFSLEGDGDAQLAERAYRSWVTASERLGNLERGHGVRRQLSQEYFASASKLTPEARILVGGALADADWDVAAERVAQVNGRAGRAARRSMVRAFKGTAPTLLALLGGPPKWWSPDASRPYVLIVLFVLTLAPIKVFMLHAERTSPRARAAQLERARARAQQAQKDAERERAPGMPRDRRALLQALPGDRGLPFGLPIASLRLAVGKKSCADIAGAFRDVEERIDDPPSTAGDLRSRFEPFTQALRQQCSPLTTGAP